MKITLRAAFANDADKITGLLVTSREKFLPYAPSPHTESEVNDWVREQLIPAGGVTLAISDTESVGVLAVSKSHGISWIDQLYVAPQFVGQGIGTVLVEHAINTLPRPVRLYTFQRNVKARRFYERHGFRAMSFSNGENNEEQCPDVLYELPFEVENGPLRPATGSR